MERGSRVTDLWEVILANTRLPGDVRGDLLAMVGACAVGERRIMELAAKYGAALLRASVRYVVDYSETRLRAEIRDWPDGVYAHTEYVDHDFAGTRDVPIAVTLTVSGRRSHRQLRRLERAGARVYQQSARQYALSGLHRDHGAVPRHPDQLWLLPADRRSSYPTERRQPAGACARRPLHARARDDGHRRGDEGVRAGHARARRHAPRAT